MKTEEGATRRQGLLSPFEVTPAGVVGQAHGAILLALGEVLALELTAS
jgi:hypothetical protein